VQATAFNRRLLLVFFENIWRTNGQLIRVAHKLTQSRMLAQQLPLVIDFDFC
jgi:hypothetical protein